MHEMFPWYLYFLEDISSLSHCVVFLYFFALITEEGFLISPCYSLERPGIRNHQIAVRDRSEYSMGANSTTDIWQAQTFAEKGFDGLIHIKSANCTPEVDIMPVLANLSQDFKIPVLYLTYDSQSSDVGLMTRLEAFYDMIEMRKKVAA